jgi:hypothetical protein
VTKLQIPKELRDAIARVQGELANLPQEDRRQAEEEVIAEIKSVERALVGDWLYIWFGGPARTAKIAVQMATAFGAVTFLAIRAVRYVYGHGIYLSDLDPSVATKFILGVIGLALALATAVELAYTLFTDGPDEAVDPAILGLASAMLIQFSYVEHFYYGDAIATLLYVAALAALFVIRKNLVEVDDNALSSTSWRGRRRLRDVFRRWQERKK